MKKFNKKLLKILLTVHPKLILQNLSIHQIYLFLKIN